MRRGADISPDGKYRYTLSRIWDHSLPTVTFIGLNPSTADDKTDDRTVLTCIDYAKRWGHGGLFIANLFAFRDTHQTRIWNVPDPVGPENDACLVELAAKSSLVIAAWGNPGCRLGRSAAVCRLVPRLHCLKVNQSGEPHHPLYLSAIIEPQPYYRAG